MRRWWKISQSIKIGLPLGEQDSDHFRLQCLPFLDEIVLSVEDHSKIQLEYLLSRLSWQQSQCWLILCQKIRCLSTILKNSSDGMNGREEWTTLCFNLVLGKQSQSLEVFDLQVLSFIVRLLQQGSCPKSYQHKGRTKERSSQHHCWCRHYPKLCFLLERIGTICTHSLLLRP
jgi:hypothetical protein